MNIPLGIQGPLVPKRRLRYLFSCPHCGKLFKTPHRKRNHLEVCDKK